MKVGIFIESFVQKPTRFCECIQKNQKPEMSEIRVYRLYISISYKFLTDGMFYPLKFLTYMSIQAYYCNSTDN